MTLALHPDDWSRNWTECPAGVELLLSFSGAPEVEILRAPDNFGGLPKTGYPTERGEPTAFIMTFDPKGYSWI